MLNVSNGKVQKCHITLDIVINTVNFTRLPNQFHGSYFYISAFTDRGKQKSQPFKPLSFVHLDFEIRYNKSKIEVSLVAYCKNYRKKEFGCTFVVPSTPGFYEIGFEFDQEIKVIAIMSVVPKVINDFQIAGVPKFEEKFISRKELEYIDSGQFSTILKPKDDDSYVIKYASNEYQSIKNYDELQNYFILVYHPSLLLVKGFCVLNKRLCPLYEYHSKGNLADFIKKRKMKGFEKVKAIYGICSALVYLHSHGFIHRDLKPENILINEDNEVILCDLNVCRRKNKDDIMTIAVGTKKYVAPEVFDSNDYNFQCDIYSAAKVFEFILNDGEVSSEKSDQNIFNPYKLIQCFIDKENPSERFVLDYIMYLIEERIFVVGKYEKKERKNIKGYLKRQLMFYNRSQLRNDLQSHLYDLRSWISYFNIGFIMYRCEINGCSEYIKIFDNINWCKNFLIFLGIKETEVALDVELVVKNQDDSIEYQEKCEIIERFDKNLFSFNSSLLYFSSNYYKDHEADKFFFGLAVRSGSNKAIYVLYSVTKDPYYMFLSFRINSNMKYYILKEFCILNDVFPQFENVFKSEAEAGDKVCATLLEQYHQSHEHNSDSNKTKTSKSVDYYGMYLLSIFEMCRYDIAIDYLKSGAEVGDSKCLLTLGTEYYYGESIPQDIGQALCCFMFSYKEQLRSAKYISEIYRYGVNVEKNEQYSIYFLKDHLENNLQDVNSWGEYANILYKWKRYEESFQVCCDMYKNFGVAYLNLIAKLQIYLDEEEERVLFYINLVKSKYTEKAKIIPLLS